jgi:hypothetical protein
MAAIVSKVVARGAALACAVGIIGTILQMAAVEPLAFLDAAMSASTQMGHSTPRWMVVVLSALLAMQESIKQLWVARCACSVHQASTVNTQQLLLALIVRLGPI